MIQYYEPTLEGPATLLLAWRQALQTLLREAPATFLQLCRNEDNKQKDSENTNDSFIIVIQHPQFSSSRFFCRRPQIILQTAAMLGGLQPRQFLTQLLNFALVLSTAFMLWKGLSVATDSPSPIVVVLSGSMEPAFQRGDLLFLWNRGQNTQIGEIVVYNVKGKDIPIVHRVVRRYGGG